MNDKKIIYKKTNKEIEIGDEIIVDVKIKSILTEDFINKNSHLFIIKDVIPDYFKCIKIIEDGGYTKGRIYKHKNKLVYPKFIGLVNDKGEEVYVYIDGKTTYFIPSDKAEWDKQELLDEAKRRYPIGTVYKHFNSEYTINSPDMLTVSEIDHHFEGETAFETSIWVKSETYNGVVYTNGEWAEILPLKFTTEDGVDIYGDMKTYLVGPNTSVDMPLSHSSWSGSLMGSSCKYFYHKENALAYIEKHKEKTLKDYEEMLFKNESSIVFSGKGTYYSTYDWIRDNEPKLYYTKILQLIADDLNDGRYIHIRGNTSYHLSNAHSVNLHCGGDEGCVYFKSKELVEKARAILGDKVKYLFN